MLIALLLALPAAAPGQDPPRQTFEGGLTEARPGTASGFVEAIDYIPPPGANGKPYAVQTVRLTLPAGTRIDTTVPERCEASDLELQQRGAAACPPGSRVGGGDVEVDSGQAVGTIPRVIRLRATLFNDEDAVIVFFESTNAQPQIRAVARSPIEGTTITTNAPPLPGIPPPDPFLAVKSVRIAFERVTRDGRGYITTPSACPPARAWTTTGSFTYRDGITETVTSNRACVHAGAAPAGPRVSLAGVPRGRCTGRSFVARTRVIAPAGVRRARLYVDGRLVARTRRSRFSRRIHVARLAVGSHRVRVVAVDRSGAVARARATFRRCRSAPAFAG